MPALPVSGPSTCCLQWTWTCRAPAVSAAWNRRTAKSATKLPGVLRRRCSSKSFATLALQPNIDSVRTNETITRQSQAGRHPPPFFPSIGFSGAGFLVSYHLGVVSALTDHGILPRQPICYTVPPSHPSGATLATHTHDSDTTTGTEIVLTGVSAGSIVAASVLAGMDPIAIGMPAVSQVSARVRDASHPILDTLQPGLSLIDVVDQVFAPLLRDAVVRDCVGEEEKTNAEAAFVRRANRQLRIGLTDRRVFPPVGYNPAAVLTVDKYRNLDDVWAACILSSYVPGVTGPALGSHAAQNLAVERAMHVMSEMIQHGCVKRGLTKERLTIDNETEKVYSGSNNKTNTTAFSWMKSGLGRNREICWDGGLVNAFPVIDKNTLIVSPIAACFHGHASISPAISYGDKQQYPTNDRNKSEPHSILEPLLPPSVRVSPLVNVHLTAANITTFLSRMMFSSNDDFLERKFRQGYHNATCFVQRTQVPVQQSHVNA